MKKMKILLGNNTLSILGGSETATYTLAIQLKKMGHEDVSGNMRFLSAFGLAWIQ